MVGKMFHDIQWQQKEIEKIFFFYISNKTLRSRKCKCNFGSFDSPTTFITNISSFVIDLLSLFLHCYLSAVVDVEMRPCYKQTHTKPHYMTSVLKQVETPARVIMSFKLRISQITKHSLNFPEQTQYSISHVSVMYNFELGSGHYTVKIISVILLFQNNLLTILGFQWSTYCGGRDLAPMRPVALLYFIVCFGKCFGRDVSMMWIFCLGAHCCMRPVPFFFRVCLL